MITARQKGLDALRKAIEREEAGLKNRSGHGVVASDTGPITITIVNALATVLEAQATEFEKLKALIVGSDAAGMPAS